MRVVLHCIDEDERIWDAPFYVAFFTFPRIPTKDREIYSRVRSVRSESQDGTETSTIKIVSAGILHFNKRNALQMQSR